MGIKLLLADDSITIQKVVGIIFASDEYELSLVDNGNAALARAKELIPDVFLVDAIMPGMNGYEVCAEVRNDPVLKDVPLLLLTGAFEPFDEERAKKCGADDTITKPFESQQLIDKVGALLELGRERASAASAVPDAPAELVTPVAASGIANADAWGTDEVSFGATTGDAWNDNTVSQGMNLWDELSAVTELPPAVDEPAAGFEPFSAAAPAFPPSDQGWTVPVEPEPSRATDTVTAPEMVVAPAVEPSPAMETVEALPEDDLWGAFVLEEEVEEPVQFGDVIEAETDDLLGEIEEIEPLTLAEDELDEAETSLPDEPALPGPYVQEFSFSDEEPAVPGTEFFLDEEVGVEPSVETVVAPSYPESFSFDEPPVAIDEPVVPEPAPEQMEAPEETCVPPVAAVSAPAAAEPAISEEQLVAALSRLSRDVIEKIVWDVVPDLAEMLIREELRKIREQA
jgi:CheY-like chemotaxis protein